MILPPHHFAIMLASILFTAPAATAGAVQVEWRHLVDAVAQVESGGDHQARGDRGRAAGAWQLHREAWADVSAMRRKAAYRTHTYAKWATDPGIARAYASDYLALLAGRLGQRYGRPPSCAEIYAAYNLGLTKFVQRYGARLADVPASVKTACNRLEILVRAAQADSGKTMKRQNHGKPGNSKA